MLRERHAAGEPARLDDALEIARLYARKRALGSGVGARAHAARDRRGGGARKGRRLARRVGSNARAIQFYESWEFHRAGTQPFLLGTDLQTDLVMVRRLARES